MHVTRCSDAHFLDVTTATCTRGSLDMHTSLSQHCAQVAHALDLTLPTHTHVGLNCMHPLTLCTQAGRDAALLRAEAQAVSAEAAVLREALADAAAAGASDAELREQVWPGYARMLLPPNPALGTHHQRMFIATCTPFDFSRSFSPYSPPVRRAITAGSGAGQGWPRAGATVRPAQRPG